MNIYIIKTLYLQVVFFSGLLSFNWFYISNLLLMIYEKIVTLDILFLKIDRLKYIYVFIFIIVLYS